MNRVSSPSKIRDHFLPLLAVTSLLFGTIVVGIGATQPIVDPTESFAFDHFDRHTYPGVRVTKVCHYSYQVTAVSFRPPAFDGACTICSIAPAFWLRRAARRRCQRDARGLTVGA